MITSYISHSECMLHDMGPWHPESPHRISSINQQLERSALAQELQHYNARPATEEQIIRVHPRAHVLSLELSQPQEGAPLVQIDDDTLMGHQTMHAATMAAGAVVRGTEQVLKNQADNVFCAVRPPGHHAERVESMGFCFLNNVAIGVEHARHNFGIKKVAIIDFDVHHGNGTVDIYKDDPDVLVCSSFQHPYFPWRFADSEWDNIVNTPLKAGCNGPEFRNLVEDTWLPALQMHRPEMIFISAGFDAHKEDPMGEINLIDEDFFWVTKMIMDVARTYCDGKIVSVLEGGYNLSALGSAAHKHIEALKGL